MKYKGVTVFAPEAYLAVRGEGLDKMLYRAMTYGNFRKPAPSVPTENGPVQMTKIEGLDYNLVPAADVMDILQLPNTRVENYPCWVEIPAAEVDSAVPFADKVNGVGGEVDENLVEITPPADRKWNEMPGYIELEGKHYCWMSEPKSRQANGNGRRPLSSEILRQVVAAGYQLVDNYTIASIRASIATDEDVI